VSERRLVADLLQEALGPEQATESIDFHARQALYHLVSALAWADNNPDRAVYYETLGDLHRDDTSPHVAACLTAAAWLTSEVRP
jgi:hypothetical protein